MTSICLYSVVVNSQIYLSEFMMKYLGLCFLFALTSCAIFKTNEELVKVNRKYSDVNAQISNNCFLFYNLYIKETDSYSANWEPRTTLIYDKGLGYMLSEDTEDMIFDKLLAASEACKIEYPEKSERVKDIILQMKARREAYIKAKEEKLADEKAKQKRIEKEKLAKKQQMKDMEKQYGYPWCSPSHLFFTQDKCMDSVAGMWFHVLQQLPDGTLVSFIKDPSYVLFISKNSKDSSLPDEYPIYDGLFAVDGIYQYTSILGSTRTVKRLKRLK